MTPARRRSHSRGGLPRAGCWGTSAQAKACRTKSPWQRRRGCQREVGWGGQRPPAEGQAPLTWPARPLPSSPASGRSTFLCVTVCPTPHLTEPSLNPHHRRGARRPPAHPSLCAHGETEALGLRAHTGSPGSCLHTPLTFTKRPSAMLRGRAIPRVQPTPAAGSRLCLLGAPCKEGSAPQKMGVKSRAWHHSQHCVCSGQPGGPRKTGEQGTQAPAHRVPGGLALLGRRL